MQQTVVVVATSERVIPGSKAKVTWTVVDPESGEESSDVRTTRTCGVEGMFVGMMDAASPSLLRRVCTCGEGMFMWRRGGGMMGGTYHTPLSLRSEDPAPDPHLPFSSLPPNPPRHTQEGLSTSSPTIEVLTWSNYRRAKKMYGKEYSLFALGVLPPVLLPLLVWLALSATNERRYGVKKRR